ncbi:hypothetical protein NQZ68_037995 [Dissostichus eleginoides]|nr:hypothetical protein NQZ68_037995 [Dissostichus eleginoides]
MDRYIYTGCQLSNSSAMASPSIATLFFSHWSELLDRKLNKEFGFERSYVSFPESQTSWTLLVNKIPPCYKHRVIKPLEELVAVR